LGVVCLLPDLPVHVTGLTGVVGALILAFKVVSVEGRKWYALTRREPLPPELPSSPPTNASSVSVPDRRTETTSDHHG
jgi:hypothetical protein